MHLPMTEFYFSLSRWNFPPQTGIYLLGYSKPAGNLWIVLLGENEPLPLLQDRKSNGVKYRRIRTTELIRLCCNCEKKWHLDLQSQEFKENGIHLESCLLSINIAHCRTLPFDFAYGQCVNKGFWTNIFQSERLCGLNFMRRDYVSGLLCEDSEACLKIPLPSVSWRWSSCAVS